MSNAPSEQFCCSILFISNERAGSLEDSTSHLQRVIHKFLQQIHILSGKIQKKTNHTGTQNVVFYINNPSFKSIRPFGRLYGPNTQKPVDQPTEKIKKSFFVQILLQSERILVNRSTPFPKHSQMVHQRFERCVKSLDSCIADVTAMFFLQALPSVGQYQFVFANLALTGVWMIVLGDTSMSTSICRCF